MSDQFGETLILAIFYMYFVAFAGSMGVLTTVGIGYKLYKRGRKGRVKHARA